MKYILDNVELLKDILTYHVVAFEISPSILSSILQTYEFPTVQAPNSYQRLSWKRIHFNIRSRQGK